MHPDDHVCLCFGVSLRKIVNFCQRERPRYASQISDCLSAGTGCQWCVPFLRKLHGQVMAGEPHPDLPVSPEDYAKRRARYRLTGRREEPAGAERPADTARGHTAAPADRPAGENSSSAI